MTNTTVPISAYQGHETTPFDERVSVEISSSRMQTTVNVSCEAIDALGQLAQYRVKQTASALSSLDRHVQEAGTSISRQAVEHFHMMEYSYLRHIATVTVNASNRITAFADWTPPVSGFIKSLLRLIRVHTINRRIATLVASQDDSEPSADDAAEESHVHFSPMHSPHMPPSPRNVQEAEPATSPEPNWIWSNNGNPHFR